MSARMNNGPFLGDFPVEITNRILGYANPSFLASVSFKWAQLSKDSGIWEDRLRKFFPYVFEGQRRGQKPPTDYEFLFKKEYQKAVSSVIKHNARNKIEPELFFAALEGDLTTIDRVRLAAQIKQRLFILAATNGHVEAISKLNLDEKFEVLLSLNARATLEYLFQEDTLFKSEYPNKEELIQEALLRVIKKGFLSMLDGFFDNHRPLWENEEFLKKCVQVASQYGQVEIIKYFQSMPNSILRQDGVVDSCIAEGLEYSQLSIVKLFLDENYQLPELGLFMRAAFNSGNIKMVDYLLQHYSNLGYQDNLYLDDELIPGGALLYGVLCSSFKVYDVWSMTDVESQARLSKQFSLVIEVIDRGDMDISSTEAASVVKGRVLCIAAFLGFSSIVKHLMQTQRASLSSQDISEAMTASFLMGLTISWLEVAYQYSRLRKFAGPLYGKLSSLLLPSENLDRIAAFGKQFSSAIDSVEEEPVIAEEHVEPLLISQDRYIQLEEALWPRNNKKQEAATTTSSSLPLRLRR